MFVAPIVEGHGEVDAVPILLDRIARELSSTYLKVNPPIRVKRDEFLKFTTAFRSRIELAANKAKQGEGFVLIMIDADDDCPANLGPRLLAQAKAVRSDVQFVVSVVYREYETWFMHAAESLAGKAGLSADLTSHPEPETVGDAKGWLNRNMSVKYRETTHQPELTRLFDLTAARRSRSFDRFVDRILAELNRA